MSKNMTRIVLELTDQEMDMLNHIATRKLHRNRTETMRYCMSFVYEKMNPAYVDRRVRQTPEEKALDKVLASEKAQELKEQRKIESKTKICSALGGEIIDIGGVKHCRYNQYQETGGKKVDVSLMTEPLEDLSEDSTHYQFQDLAGNKGEEVKQKLLGFMNKN